MENLTAILNNNGSRQAVVNDSVRLVESEVGRKKGVSGFAIKNGYKLVSKLKGGRMTHIMVDKMLDQFVSALDPFHASYEQANSGESFASYLTQRDDAVAESLLAATDRRRQAESNKALTGAYDKLRPMAKRNVVEAVPAIGRMVESHLS